MAAVLVGPACDVPEDMPEDWRQIELKSGIGFAVPSGAVRAGGTAVDSDAGYFDGDGYRITYDYGRFGEDLGVYADAEGYTRAERRRNGHPIVEIGFVPTDEDFGWARVLQIDLGRGRTLTVRVSCVSKDRCGLADRVFESVTL